jgi:hypothetical protein
VTARSKSFTGCAICPICASLKSSLVGVMASRLQIGYS